MNNSLYIYILQLHAIKSININSIKYIIIINSIYIIYSHM